MAQGMSVVVCSHNGALRLPTTLAHLKAQGPSPVPWELLVINNASTDDTGNVARSCWGEATVPFRVVEESTLGLQSARQRGFREAKYDFIAFVDDDNWVASDWVQVAYEALASEPSMGAVGSICDPVFEVAPPEWFGEFHSIYAIITHADLENTLQPAFLHGAGLCIRKQARTQLIQGGFRHLLAGRVGKRLTGGEDTELTSAIRLAGWKIRVEPRLRLQHFMPAQRLRWEYLRRLERGYAASQALLDAYSTHNLSMRLPLKPRLGQIWWCQAGRSLFELIRRPRGVLLAVTSIAECRQDVIEVERHFGRILGLLQLRKKYGASRRHVRYAPWRLRRPEEYLRQTNPANA
jgi:cellulose synthase/poly-beta-1,6-N-acetylglucosamine synthase-like glycosyltransferase